MTHTIAWVDPQPADELAFGRALLPDGFTLVGHADGFTAGAAWGEAAAGADALITRHLPVGADVMAAAPAARFVQKYGGREDGLDLAAVASAGARAATMPLRGCVAVAEMAMTHILALSKQLIEGHEATRTGAYRERGGIPAPTTQRSFAFQWMGLEGLFELQGRTLGIVGFGEIGTEVAARARAFGMDVLYTKRSRLPESIEDRLHVAWAELDKLLATSDVVLLSTPLTPETEGIIGAEQLALMRAHAVLVNIARGPLVDEDALRAALVAGTIAGAGLDVFVEEPVPFDHPLLALPNVVLSPHVGGGTGGAREKQLRDVLDNVVRAARGESVHHLIAGPAT